MVNMGRSMVLLLLLGLTDAALHRYAPSNDPIDFDFAGGNALSISLSDAKFSSELPTSEWSIQSWLRFNHKQAMVIEILNPFISLDWTSTIFRLYADVGDSQTIETISQLKWVFVQFGSTALMTYGVITIRNSLQYFLSVNGGNEVSSSSSIQFIDGCDHLVVIET